MQTVFDCLLDAVPHGVLVVDATRTIVASNASAASLLDHTANELAGRRLDELLGERSRRQLIEAGARLLGACPMNGERHREPVEIVRSDGGERALSLELRRVSHDGRPALLVLMQDRAQFCRETSTRLSSLSNVTELERTNDRHRVTLEAAPTGMLVVNERSEIASASEQIERIFGYARGELVGQPLEALVPPLQRGRKVGLRELLLETPTLPSTSAGQELYAVHHDSREIPVEIALLPLDTADGRLTVVSIFDISARQRAERALRESDARHRALFEDSPVPLVELDLSATRAFLSALDASGITEQLDAHFGAHPEALRHAIDTVETVAMNQGALELFEANDATQLSEALTLFGPDTALWFRAAIRELYSGGAHFSGETTMRTLSGASRAVSMRIHLLPGHTDTWSRAVVSLFDLTAHELVEERLRSSLREKEVLLREVHHRVKNNLQIVSSLLNLKADTIENAAAQQVFADCQTRIRSLAFVHEHLYVASDLSHVPFGQYLRTLVAHLEQSFRAPGQEVQVRVAVGELNLSIDDAIPCGLIVNELVTNSLKHAFVAGSPGTIEIRMRRLPGHRLELSVADDGKGLPNGIDGQDSGGSGLDLVYTFAEQLGAEVEIARQRGTRFTLRFEAARDRPTTS
jgi:PAS domain S-box-containing protein